MAKNKTAPEPKQLIWEKIRFFQRANEISNEELAELLDVKPKTLLTYDKTADNITLGKIDHFVKYNHYGVTYAKLMKDVFTVNEFMNS